MIRRRSLQDEKRRDATVEYRRDERHVLRWPNMVMVAFRWSGRRAFWSYGVHVWSYGVHFGHTGNEVRREELVKCGFLDTPYTLNYDLNVFRMLVLCEV